jgi:flagellar capping protein FliD
VEFQITQDADGNLWGQLSDPTSKLAPQPATKVVDGNLQGSGDYTGLSLTVTGPGSGTLNLSRGAGQAASDLMSAFTGVSGGIASVLKSITTQDKSLDLQIQSGQARLDTETANLKKQFARMEALVGQMKAAAGSLSGA